MPFTPTEAKYPVADNISTGGSQPYSLADYAHDEIIKEISDNADAIATNTQNITANAERVQANETELAAHDADIKELQKNNPLVELKDTVTESAETNSETHDIKETTSDGTENSVSNFVLAQKQITKLETDATAGTLTVSTIDQTGTTASETLTLPAGGGAAYDDTQVKADIAKNTTDIAKNTTDIAKNTTDIASIKDTKNNIIQSTETEIGSIGDKKIYSKVIEKEVNIPSDDSGWTAIGTLNDLCGSDNAILIMVCIATYVPSSNWYLSQSNRWSAWAVKENALKVSQYTGLAETTRYITLFYVK